MIRGIYTAGAGMLAESVRTDVTANNMANATTAGFKKEIAVNKDFASLLVQRINDGGNNPAIGTMGSGALVDEIVTSHATGNYKFTGNSLDLALEGPGFFVIETPAGNRYTRNGTFSRSVQGELVNQDGLRVLGQNGPIQLTGTTGAAGRVDIAPDGRVFVDDVEADTLRIVEFGDLKKLAKQGNTLFQTPDGTQPVNAERSQIRQGYQEMSNVNIVSEMVNLIAGYRAYEVNSKAVQTHDQLLDKAVNQVGQV